MEKVPVVSVVAGGWSFGEQGVDHKKLPGKVIAVNDAMLHLTCEIGAIVGMDRLWAEHRWASIQHRALPTYIRVEALKNLHSWRGDALNPPWPWFYPFACARVPEFAETLVGGRVTQLNGTHSGGCALNLAYLMRPKELYLWGFDMRRSPSSDRAHWYPAYSWVDPARGAKGATGTGTYRKWAQEFEVIAEAFKRIGTHVFNMSPESLITAFQKYDARDLGCTR